MTEILERAEKELRWKQGGAGGKLDLVISTKHSTCKTFFFSYRRAFIGLIIRRETCK